MTYFDIFALGWNLNALMFFINFIISLRLFRSEADADVIQEKMATLKQLQVEFEKYYPNRKLEVIFMYLLPFASFFRTIYRLFEMTLFFSKNQGTTLYDFMVYKYYNDIQRAKLK